MVTTVWLSTDKQDERGDDSVVKYRQTGRTW